MKTKTPGRAKYSGEPGGGGIKRNNWFLLFG